MSEQAIGILVQEPNHSLIRWIKVTTFVYFMYYAYLFSGYLTNGVESSLRWIVTVMCLYVVTIWLPMYGIKAVQNSNTRALSAFSVLQSCLCLWYVMQLSFLMVTLSITINACQDCQASFDAGNATCYVQTEFKILQINAQNCQQSIPNLDQLIVSFFYFSMALTSCLSMVYARKTNSVKYVTASNIVQQVPELWELSDSELSDSELSSKTPESPTVQIPIQVQVSESPAASI
jgi:hypothetical protein